MSVGIGQIILLIFIFLVLFGKMPDVFNDFYKGLKRLKDFNDSNLSQSKEDISQKYLDAKGRKSIDPEEESGKKKDVKGS